MKIKHSKEKDVAAIVNARLSTRKAAGAFAKLINKGSWYKNIEKCERIPNSPIRSNAVTCYMCQSTHSKNHIRRHEKSCRRRMEAGIQVIKTEVTEKEEG